MTINDVEIGDVILVPVTIGKYPDGKHLKEYQRVVRAQLGHSQMVYLGNEELKHAKKFNS